jgi:hypothetical protein
VTDNSDAYVARVLVDMGLLAPRLAFPGDFLDHVFASGRLYGASVRYAALVRHWKDIGEDLFITNNEYAFSECRMQSFLSTV